MVDQCPPGDIVGCPWAVDGGEGAVVATGIQWVKARDAVQHANIPRSLPLNKDLSGQK